MIAGKEKEKKKGNNSILLLTPSLHLVRKHRHLAAFSIFAAVPPFFVVPNAPNIVVKPNGAAGGHSQLLAVERALPQQRNTAEWRLSIFTIIGLIFLLTGAFVQRLKVDAMLESTLFDKVPFRNTRVCIDQAVGEPQGSDGGGARSIGGNFASVVKREREVCSTEHEDVPDAFFGAMFAVDFGGLVGDTIVIS